MRVHAALLPPYKKDVEYSLGLQYITGMAAPVARLGSSRGDLGRSR